MASDFEKMKEEFDALRKSDFLGDDLDIELSDSSLDGYDDDFELQSPKVSTMILVSMRQARLKEDLHCRPARQHWEWTAKGS